MPNTIRCFISIEIPEKLKKRLVLLREELNVDGIRTVKQGNMHITVKFLGEIGSDRIEIVEDKLRDINFSNFNIRLRGVGVFPNEKYIKVIWVGCESKELYILAKKIEETLKDFRKEKFTAHLTIARVKRRVELHNFLEKHKNDDFGQFICSRFELGQSELKREGPVYKNLASFEGKS